MLLVTNLTSFLHWFELNILLQICSNCHNVLVYENNAEFRLCHDTGATRPSHGDPEKPLIRKVERDGFQFGMMSFDDPFLRY
ncbi:hypothetical protein L596_011728 [Steinernema carpocapsae]|uniref:Uncharacterized protein n=1 Tax=Steinernema carpocapsae TaxID=34508 RepID=A0A4U5NVS0_STECR|nr:hypothetical protein L596_011728 [Steinernema carpocapsae]